MTELLTKVKGRVGSGNGKIDKLDQAILEVAIKYDIDEETVMTIVNAVIDGYKANLTSKELDDYLDEVWEKASIQFQITQELASSIAVDFFMKTK